MKLVTVYEDPFGRSMQYQQPMLLQQISVRNASEHIRRNKIYWIIMRLFKKGRVSVTEVSILKYDMATFYTT